MTCLYVRSVWFRPWRMDERLRCLTHGESIETRWFGGTAERATAGLLACVEQREREALVRKCALREAG